MPAGARWLRLGWGCPVSTQTQYASADDLVLNLITDSEPGPAVAAAPTARSCRSASDGACLQDSRRNVGGRGERVRGRRPGRRQC